MAALANRQRNSIPLIGGSLCPTEARITDPLRHPIERDVRLLIRPVSDFRGLSQRQ